MARDYTTEELIAKHRPRPENEREVAGSAQLMHLNVYGLMEEAVESQAHWNSENDAEASGEPPVINKLVAWRVLADAQRNGLELEPISAIKRSGVGMKRRRPRLPQQQ
jgi:hypothetical protein